MCLATFRPIRISIHAPVKGATCETRPVPADEDHFNPRSREGSDSPLQGVLRVNGISIHAPVKGATAILFPTMALPRKISIHAPVKGATLPLLIDHMPSIISIHAPVKGATWWPGPGPCSPGNFNPRSREGSDWPWWSTPRTPTYFNPRSREGSDLPRPSSTPKGTYFNPRSREGSDRCWTAYVASSWVFQSTPCGDYVCILTTAFSNADHAYKPTTIQACAIVTF